MVDGQRSVRRLRARFDEIYDSRIVGGGFVETDEYYRQEKERYWRSLHFLCGLDIPLPAKILEVGGGQMAILCKSLFGDDCTVGDISNAYSAPLQKAQIPLVDLNLTDDEPGKTIKDQFDVIVMLEVIEHIPVPAYIVFDRLKHLLKPKGLLFLTTPNLFRLRNLFRMALGVEFLDRFMVPEPGQGLGHQLEYSADHLRWQLERAGAQVVLMQHDNFGRTGHSTKARVAHNLLAPLALRPIWRKGLVAAAQRADASV